MKKLLPHVVSYVILLSFASLLQSQTPQLKSLAVLQLDARGAVSQDEARTLTDRLRSMLVRTQKLTVLERGKMEEILREKGLEQAGCISTECIIDAGKMLKVQLMVGGSVGKIGRVYTVDIILIDVESSRIIASLSHDHRGEIEGLLDLMRPIAEQLASFAEERGRTALNLGSLTVTSDPVPATIFLNDNNMGQSPKTIDNISPGEYSIRLLAEGYAPIEGRVTIEKGKVTEYKATLKKLVTVNILSIPTDATLIINESVVGKTPYSKNYVPGTRLSIRIRKENYSDWTWQEIVTRDTTLIASLVYGGSVMVTTRPAHAEVFLDGKPLGFSPLRRDSIPPGEHSLKIVLEGYAPLEEKVAIGVGRVAERSYSLRKVCTVTIISTPPGAQVWIDSQRVGETPYHYQVAAGTRTTVTLRQEKYRDWQREYTVTADLTITVQLKEKRSPWVRLGASAVLVGGGVAAYFLWQKEQRKAPAGDTGFPRPPGRP